MPYFSPAELHELVHEAPLRTLELRASAPVINRYIAALDRGAPAPRIPVGEGTVLEGSLHWYVAVLALGRQPLVEKTSPPKPTLIRYSMRQVIFEGLDWENMVGRRP